MSYMSREERVAHARAANVALDHRIAEESRQAFILNLAQFMRPLGRAECDIFVTMIMQYSGTIATLARLQALGIDPESARPTENEIEEYQRGIEARHTSVKTMPYMTSSRRRGN